MKQIDKIKQRLKEEDDKLKTQINTSKQDLDGVMKQVNNLSKNSGSASGGDVEINLIDETETPVMNVESLKFVSDIDGEEAFIVKGNKYRLVNASGENGNSEVGVFCYGNEKVIPFTYFKETFIGKKVEEDTNRGIGNAAGTSGDKNVNNASFGGDDYESVSRGAEKGEVGGSDWEELIDLLQPATPIKEVKGRISKAKLEEHVKSINKPKVLKVVKIKDILK